MNIDEIRARAEAATENIKLIRTYMDNADTERRIDGSLYSSVIDNLPISEIILSEDIPALLDALEAKERENKVLRNELCFKCGQYREAHNGACDGCKWRKEQNDG